MAKRIERDDREVWQVSVRKLRCWLEAQPGVEAPPNRPYCIFVSCLHPTGRLLTRHLAKPYEVLPDSRVVLGQILRVIAEPPAGLMQHRPGKVVFSSREYASSCAKSLAAIGIETSVLSDAPALKEYVVAFSRQMAEQEIARISAASEQPGLLATNPPALVKAFFAMAAEFARAKPWTRISERQTLRLRADATATPAPGVTVQPGVVWVQTVVRFETVMRR